MLRKTPLMIALASALTMSAVAFADDTTPGESPDVADNDSSETPAADDKLAPATPDEDLPKPASDNDPQPKVAEPELPPGGLVKQAGVGGTVGYGRAGVLELGGSAGLTVASDFRDVNFSPSIGWFIADNLELSAIFGVSHISTEMDSSTLVSALAEPSYHLPFNRSVFGFLGLGVGGSYVEGLGGGFAVAPRIGANVMVGRSGVLSPSLSWQYTTHSIDTNDNGPTDTAILAVSSALRVNVGYTVMW